MFGWLRGLTRPERDTLLAAFGGWAVDAFDYMIYTFAIPALIAAWGMSRAEAGLIATSTLLCSAAGGWLAGALSDRVGRVRMLQITIAWFALFTFLSGFSRSLESEVYVILGAPQLDDSPFTIDYGRMTLTFGQRPGARRSRSASTASSDSERARPRAAPWAVNTWGRRRSSASTRRAWSAGSRCRPSPSSAA